MEKVLKIFLFLCCILHITPLECRDKMLDSPVYEEEYTYGTSDSAQKKQAVGMTFTGFALFIGIALLSGFIPTDVGTTTTTPLPNPQTGNTILQ